ncbi:MAG: DUF4261 domain-containing protein [Bradyrhizobiaceae bacterium]|nr:DUF4261 domain-containing protein [Bradyrhizobiaceae bacterium]
MFGFSKKKQADSPKASWGRGIMSVVLLEGESFPIDSFVKQMAKTRVAGKAVSGVSRDEGGAFGFNVGDELFALAHMPAPYPANDLEGPIATSWMWPENPPIENVKQHRSFLLIYMTGGAADPVRRRLTLTAVTALAAKQSGVMAVFWPQATLVIFPRLFVDMSEEINSPQAPPLYLWVDLRAFRNADGTTGLFTTGLSQLGHMEIEIPSIDMEIGELREWLLNIMYYLLEKGPVLMDGQTIGTSAEDQIRIRHCPSSFGHPGKVIRLES